jgi:hypothetical protein
MKDDRKKPAAPSCGLKYEHSKRSLVENPDGVFILHSSKEEARNCHAPWRDWYPFVEHETEAAPW